MKKLVSISLIIGLCAVGLSGCIQVTAPAPQQQAAPVQTQAPVQAQAPQQTQPVQQAQPVVPVQPAPVQGGYQIPQFAITLDQAKQTALNAVGMSAANVTFTKQKQDYDDGMPEYEIEFVANNMKYEFEVSGMNGAILKQEVESILY